jgi:hypothetical protein
MRFKTPLTGLVVLLLIAAGDVDARQDTAAPALTTGACPVTHPNGVVADASESNLSSHGNRGVSVALWSEGTVVFKPGGPGFLTRSGALGMKFGWWRGVSGELRIEGRRLDGHASPLQSEVPSGYGPTGFQASYVIFPTPGCWEVTGRVADARVTFVTMVVKVGDGPSWRRDRP